MAKINRFEDLQSWQKARQLANYVYELTEHPKFSKDFRLRDQVQGAAGSVCTISPKDLMPGPTLISSGF